MFDLFFAIFVADSLRLARANLLRDWLAIRFLLFVKGKTFSGLREQVDIVGGHRGGDHALDDRDRLREIADFGVRRTLVKII